MGPVADAAVEAFRATMELNVTGTFLTIKHAAKQMKTQSPSGGSIIANSSGAGAFPHRFLPVYGAAPVSKMRPLAAGKWIRCVKIWT